MLSAQDNSTHYQRLRIRENHQTGIAFTGATSTIDVFFPTNSIDMMRMFSEHDYRGLNSI
jgi:hypothetical protein